MKRIIYLLLAVLNIIRIRLGIWKYELQSYISDGSDEDVETAANIQTMIDSGEIYIPYRLLKRLRVGDVLSSDWADGERDNDLIVNTINYYARTKIVLVNILCRGMKESDT